MTLLPWIGNAGWIQPYQVTLEYLLWAIAITLALMSLARNQMNGPFHPFQRSPILVKKCSLENGESSFAGCSCNERMR